MLSGMESNLVEKAVTAAGGIAAVAEHFEIHYQAVQQWVSKNRIPAERVIEMERLSGVSRHELCPKVFGSVPKRERARARA